MSHFSSGGLRGGEVGVADRLSRSWTRSLPLLLTYLRPASGAEAQPRRCHLSVAPGSNACAMMSYRGGGVFGGVAGGCVLWVLVLETAEAG